MFVSDLVRLIKYHQTIICIPFKAADGLFLMSLAHNLPVAACQRGEREQLANLWGP